MGAGGEGDGVWDVVGGRAGIWKLVGKKCGRGEGAVAGYIDWCGRRWGERLWVSNEYMGCGGEGMRWGRWWAVI